MFKHTKDSEKYNYIAHHQKWLTLASLISFGGVLLSSFFFFKTSVLLYVFYPYLGFTIFYFVISMFVQGFGKSFNLHKHNEILSSWEPKRYPSVDIFLPVCGEEAIIIKNTWEGVHELKEQYRGKVSVYCLDDADEPEIKKLAKKFDFKYLVRDDRGHFKKAGNLQHGFKNSQSEFIAVFDADFRPRADFLDELLPYFYEHPKLGIVQSPQYFNVHKSQNWVERGAGAVQEYFYRSIQQNTQSHGGAICVGSNAVYRRKALEANGGTTLIEHSEDVHTGFDLRRKGWGLIYIPIILAKGVCPSSLKGFFRQQYRWCKGSMSLLGSGKFWKAEVPLRSRICYISGFIYYIHTAISTIIVPLIPLGLIFVVPQQAKLLNYIPLIPAFLYSFIIFPAWHRARYRFETFMTKIVYGWAHLFALVDSIVGTNLDWRPTGTEFKRSIHYAVFKVLFVIYSLGTAILWVSSAAWHMVYWNPWNFLPVFVTGLAFLGAIVRIIWTINHEK